MADYKKIALQLKLHDEIVKVMPATVASAVVVGPDGETLKQRLASIAAKLGTSDKTVAEQIEEVRGQVADIIDNADPAAIDSLREVASWISENETKIEALELVAKGIDKAIEDALSKAIGDLGEAEDVKAYVDAAVAKEAKEREDAVVEEKLRAEKEEAKLDEKISKVFTVFESVDNYDPEKIGDNGLACILLPDDAVEVDSAAALMEAVAGDNPEIVLTADIVLSKSIDLTGKNIDCDGFTITGASQDVEIKL